MTQIQDVLTALQDALTPLGVDVYDYVPDSPNVPCIAVYCERWPYASSDPNDQPTFKLWAITGTIDMEGAQSQLMDWISDEGDNSIISLIDDDRTLGGVVSSVLPVDVQWSMNPVQDGRPRYIQAEISLQVLR